VAHASRAQKQPRRARSVGPSAHLSLAASSWTSVQRFEPHFSTLTFSNLFLLGIRGPSRQGLCEGARVLRQRRRRGSEGGLLGPVVMLACQHVKK
jgi:hypothetical protein